MFLLFLRRQPLDLTKLFFEDAEVVLVGDAVGGEEEDVFPVEGETPLGETGGAEGYPPQGFLFSKLCHYGIGLGEQNRRRRPAGVVFVVTDGVARAVDAVDGVEVVQELVGHLVSFLFIVEYSICYTGYSSTDEDCFFCNKLYTGYTGKKVYPY